MPWPSPAQRYWLDLIPTTMCPRLETKMTEFSKEDCTKICTEVDAY